MRILFPLIIVMLSFTSEVFAKADPDAHDVMLKNYYVSKVTAYDGQAEMLLINDKGQQRQRKINLWSKIKDGNEIDSQVMIVFNAPADIKGTGFLQIENSTMNLDDDIWIYLPALSKIRRMVANNKRDSFFGTDFSYGDILPPPVDKYSHNYLNNDEIDGVDCYVIESIPNDDKTLNDSGYSRKITWVDSTNFVERKIEYFDPTGKPLKTQFTYELKQIEPAKQRWVAMRREMTNHQTGHKTVYYFNTLELNQTLKDTFFSTRTLEK